jgi:hypothetical protein
MNISINPRQHVEIARGAAGTCIQGSSLRTDLTNLVAVELRMVAFCFFYIKHSMDAVHVRLEIAGHGSIERRAAQLEDMAN